MSNPPAAESLASEGSVLSPIRTSGWAAGSVEAARFARTGADGSGISGAANPETQPETIGRTSAAPNA